MATASKTAERQVTTRGFRVDPNVIRTLIANQAGSLEKAIMEAISNSMDAGAKSIELTVEPGRVVIQDNGKGLSKKEEILAFFEVFGFDHTNLGREHGRFGVGRGQLFCYGKNTWRTGQFAMEVDINTKGLDYDLEEDLPVAKGMGITIDLYERLSVRELYTLEESFRKLVKYAGIPIRYNGKQINEPANTAKDKWNQETDQAWFNIKPNGTLAIYSQGLLVKEVHSYHHGVGGVVVTKPGQALALNMARNDILTQTCEVWKAVVKDLRRFAAPFREKAERQNTLTADQRKLMALEALDAAEGTGALYTKTLFTLTNGKHVSLQRLLEKRIWAVGPSHDRLGDKAAQMNVGYALNEDTLERFGVETLAELHERITQVFQRFSKAKPKPPKGEEVSHYDWNNPKRPAWDHYRQQFQAHMTVRGKLDDLAKIQLHETTEVFRELVKTDFKEVKPGELTDDERALLHAARKVSSYIYDAVRNTRDAEARHHMMERTIKAMESDSAEACTDATTTIWINRRFLKESSKGLPAFMKLAHLLAHEYAHGDSSQGTHGHDQAFFEAFHDAVQSGQVAKAAVIMMGRYAKATKRKPTATLLSSLELVDMEGVAVFQGDMPDFVDEEPAIPAAPVVAPPAAATPARRRQRR